MKIEWLFKQVILLINYNDQLCYTASNISLNKKNMHIYELINNFWDLDHNWSLLLLSSIFYIRKKYMNCEKFRLPVFSGFPCFEMSWTRFHYFYKMFICLSVYARGLHGPEFSSPGFKKMSKIKAFRSEKIAKIGSRRPFNYVFSGKTPVFKKNNNNKRRRKR